MHHKDKAGYLGALAFSEDSGIPALSWAKRLLKRATGVIQRKKTDRYGSELFGSVITLKNLAMVHKERPLSADFIFEILMENSTALKPAYEELLTLYRSGRDDEAFRAFAERTGSREGRNFAVILSKLDRINPAEVVKQMEVFQNAMAEERMTAATKAAQRNSVLITAWAAASIFALLVNFAVVVVFLDTLGMLEHLF